MSEVDEKDRKAPRKIFNLGFMPVTYDHIETLSRAGFRNLNSSKLDNLLPVISANESPETVKYIVTTTVCELEISDGDIFIVSGIPDVGYYVVQALVDRIQELELNFVPLILVPLGRHIDGTFRVSGFRQVIVKGVGEPAIHFISRKPLRKD